MVVLPEGPIVDIEPERGPPGTEFLVGLAGFEAESEVVLHVYWADPDDAEVEILEYLGSSFYYGRYRYVTSLPILTDDSGRAAYGLVTQASDPLGGYCSFARSPQRTSCLATLLRAWVAGVTSGVDGHRASARAWRSGGRSSWLRSLLAGEVGDKHLG